MPADLQAALDKPEIAIEEIDRVRTAGVRFGCVLADAGYGMSAPFRQVLSERGLSWAVGMPIREISRRTGFPRNTIRKYMRSDAKEPLYRAPERPSKLDPVAVKLSSWLKTEASRSRKQRCRHGSCTPT